MTRQVFSRRSFLTRSAAAVPIAAAAAKGKLIPVGLELYSVRNELQKDLTGTVRAVAKQGYQVVEFFSPYYSWTPDYAKEVRKLLDELGIQCRSTHNGPNAFAPENLQKTIDLNQTIGGQYVVLASAGRVEGLDGWKKVAEMLSKAMETLRPAGLRAGYHNHQAEFRLLEGRRPIEIIAANTPKDFMLQLDVGTCVEVGQDPVAWINKNPGRIRCIHCKDWSPDPDKGYKVLFGDGAAPWRKIFQAAEKKGGVEYYLIEQEGYSLPEIETAAKCLENFKKIHGA
jgi:sugar phosphate isomerase/epimerase